MPKRDKKNAASTISLDIEDVAAIPEEQDESGKDTIETENVEEQQVLQGDDESIVIALPSVGNGVETKNEEPIVQQTTLVSTVNLDNTEMHDEKAVIVDSVVQSDDSTDPQQEPQKEIKPTDEMVAPINKQQQPSFFDKFLRGRRYF